MSTPWIDELRSSVREIGLALRRPEQLALRWRDAAPADTPSRFVIPCLLINAMLCTAAYGLTMHMHHGVAGMLHGAFFAPLAAGLSWLVALPALYIVGTSFGSRLNASTTTLAASATVSFGAMAMLASIPINWFFTLALPFAATRLLVNAAVFIGVGVCMVDVFLRVMRALEPDREQTFSAIWLALVGVIGGELFLLTGLFAF